MYENCELLSHWILLPQIVHFSVWFAFISLGIFGRDFIITLIFVFSIFCHSNHIDNDKFNFNINAHTIKTSSYSTSSNEKKITLNSANLIKFLCLMFARRLQAFEWWSQFEIEYTNVRLLSNEVNRLFHGIASHPTSCRMFIAVFLVHDFLKSTPKTASWIHLFTWKINKRQVNFFLYFC